MQGVPNEATPITLPEPPGVRMPAWSHNIPDGSLAREQRMQGASPAPGPEEFRGVAPAPEVLPVPIPGPREFHGIPPRPEALPILTPLPAPNEAHGVPPHPERLIVPLPVREIEGRPAATPP